MSDIDIIKQIETEYEITFRQSLNHIEIGNNGYIINKLGYVVALYIFVETKGRFDFLCSKLKKLRSLVELSLIGLDIVDVSLLSDFKNLTKLDLRINKISDASPLKDLKKLKVLELSSNKVSDISWLEGLVNLAEFSIASNLVDNVSVLRSLKNITTLSIGHPQLEDISPLKNLTKLTSLFIDSGQSRIISSLSDLENLSELGLYSIDIGDLSPLIKLKNLTGLNLKENKISDVSLLVELKNLKSLYITNNQISDISTLIELKNLKSLYIINNQISDIFPLAELKNLESLSLANNKISNISSLSEHKSLTTLILDNNQVSDILPLAELKSLKQLSLANNQISDVSPLEKLKDLKRLSLKKNLITELPRWITDFDMKIVWNEYAYGDISLFDNPLTIPPVEIVKEGKDAIKNYFEQIKEQNIDYLFEAKMLIVGEPGAGKTTLTWKIGNPSCNMPKDEETTKGIDVRQYYFPLKIEDFPTFDYPEKLTNKNFRLNLWDFGGQQIYKATHRFFLSKRSLYVLVADSRNENTDFNYWLHIIEMFGGESPLLIILNEKHNRKRNLDVLAMRNRFTNISEVIEVDFAEADKTRLYKLQKAVKYYVSQLPHIGSPVPAKWTVVREKLEGETHNTISLQDYIEICQNNGIVRSKDALVLSQYFHDIGVFLHFQDDELLKKTIFLKPNWATNAVYKILDHELLNQNKGRFNKDDAKTIWFEDEFEFVRDELLRLMQKFFLTYEIENSGNYIVPERLQETSPEYPWEERDNLLLQYKYDFFMPKGILSQFIVQMNRYISNHNYVWKRGVILERDSTIGEILESYDARSISIRMSGKNKRDFMTIITEQLDQINAPYEKMKVEKLIQYCL